MKLKDYMEKTARERKDITEDDFTLDVSQDLIKAIKEAVPDPRKSRGKELCFSGIMLIVVSSSLCGDTTPTGMARYADGKLDFVNSYLPEGDKLIRAPSRSTFSRVLGTIFPDDLELCLGSWLNRHFPDLTVRDDDGLRQVMLDGKAERAIANKSEGEPVRYVLNSRVLGDAIDIHILNINGKGNEHSRLVEFLGHFTKPRTLFTADAAATYGPIIETIVDKECFYFFCLKENQPSIYEAIFLHRYSLIGKKVTVEGGTTISAYNMLPSETFHKKGHGRETTTTVRVMTGKDDLAFLNTLNPSVILDSLKSVVIMEKSVTRKRKKKQGKGFELVTTKSVSFFITNIDAITPKRAYEIRTNHWSIEMGHYQLDVHFNEDRMTNREGYSLENGSMLRRFAQCMHARDPQMASQPQSAFTKANTYKSERIARLLKLERQVGAPGAA